MKKILFAHSYFLNFDPKQRKAGNAYPPLGTLYAAALAREKGYEVAVFDSMLAKSETEIEPQLKSFAPHVLVIYDDGFNYLTKMCLTKMSEAACSMAKMAKSQQIITIINSSDASDRYLHYLQNGFDYVVRGEGEWALMMLLDKIANGAINNTLSDIPNLVHLNPDGQPIVSPKMDIAKDLDSLPLPAWDLIDMDSYKSYWKQHHGYFSINIVTTRGCPYKCNWCAKPIYGNRYNAHSPEKIAEQIEYLYTKYQIEHIWFCDDIFGLKPGWISRFADALEAKNIRIPFKIQSRADLVDDLDTVKSLSKAGCSEVWIGAESGSQKILDAMDKGITLSQIKKSRELLKENNITAAFFIQFGYPGEEKEDIRLTIEMLKSLLPDNIGISVSYPLPGTIFYDNVKNQLSEKTNWKDSDDLDTMYKATFPRKYYKHLQRYAHYTYRLELYKQQSAQTWTSKTKRILKMANNTQKMAFEKMMMDFYT